MRLPAEFLARMQAQLGGDFQAYMQAMERPAVRGLRVNTLKVGVEEFLQISPWGLRPGGILNEGFVLGQGAEGMGSHPLHAAGLFYLQEPSALAPVAALGVRPGMRVLDMCAAPGGKSGAVAAQLSGSGLLVANEPVPGRAKTLLSNLQRLGVMNAAVTSALPEALAAALPAYFDAVLVDAPCSGEGMFRKDGGAVLEWSVRHVEACTQRQLGILHSAYLALRPGGRLVYSTCTFSPEENEGVIQAFLAGHPAMRLLGMQRLYPHTFEGEGHFAATLQKEGGQAQSMGSLALEPCRDAAFLAFAAQRLLPTPPAWQLKDGRVALCSELPAGLKRLRVLCAGVAAGELGGGRFTPSHALAMSGLFKDVISLAPQSAGLMAYLRGETLPAGGSGWVAVGVGRWPLGLGKCVGGTLKNHLPKGLRHG